MHSNSSTSPTLRILEVRFDLPLAIEQISAWRGAFATWGGMQEELLHNHNNQGEGKPLHYRYPLVQYRSIRGQAGIFAINEGIEVMSGLLQRPEWGIHWEGKHRLIRMEQMHMDTQPLGIDTAMRSYRLRRWIGLNEDNYQTWQSLPTFQERVALLDRALAANLLALCGGLGWKIPRRFEAWTVQINQIRRIAVHDVEMLAFDLVFSTDLILPPRIGIGKSASLGFGVVWPMQPTPVFQRHDTAE
jgi:Cas6b C-terminal domain/Cas6b N-terminal domain